MNTKNKIIISLLVSVLSISSVFAATDAENKETVLDKVETIQDNLIELKTEKVDLLNEKISVLAWKYDSIFTDLGYTDKTLDYLVGLGKLNSNFKEDLEEDTAELISLINTKITSEFNSTYWVETPIKLTSGLTSKEMEAYLETLSKIESNYNDLITLFETKIEELNTTYTSNLEWFEVKVKTAINSNKTTLSDLDIFESKYNDLYKEYDKFETNYENFRETYLAFAWELWEFSTEIQQKYFDLLDVELEKLKTVNYEKNTSLETYKNDIERTYDILLENFKNSLYIKINDSYWLIYSETDLKALISRYEATRSKYFDTDWKLRVDVVVDDESALDNITFIHSTVKDINEKITSLLWTDSTANTLANMKIRLENEVIKFYNESYKKYKEDMLLKIQEKLELLKNANNNVLLASDNIDMRLNLLNDDLTTAYTYTTYKQRIDSFRSDLDKYAYLNSEILNAKIANINSNLDIAVINKELQDSKYSKLDAPSSEVLQKVFTAFKQKHWEKAEEKLNKILEKIDKMLSAELSKEARFNFLVIKREIITFLK